MIYRILKEFVLLIKNIYLHMMISIIFISIKLQMIKIFSF
jgi:hypothetical protein